MRVRGYLHMWMYPDRPDASCNNRSIACCLAHAGKDDCAVLKHQRINVLLCSVVKLFDVAQVVQVIIV